MGTSNYLITHILQDSGGLDPDTIFIRSQLNKLIRYDSVSANVYATCK